MGLQQGSKRIKNKKPHVISARYLFRELDFDEKRFAYFFKFQSFELGTYRGINYHFSEKNTSDYWIRKQKS